MAKELILASTTTTTRIPRTYEPFIQTNDGSDPWFVHVANDLIIMNKQNRHRILFIESMMGYVGVCLLLMLAGVASGLTLALFTLDADRLKNFAAVGKGKRCEQARRVLPYLTNPHWTLVTLLVMNAIAAETLPLVINRMYGGVIAVLASVFLMLFFGEIFPQAVFTRFALPICSHFAPFLGFSRLLTAPISWPVGRLLDYLVGHRQKRFMRRVELQQLIRLHQTEEKNKRHEERDVALIEATLKSHHGHHHHHNHHPSHSHGEALGGTVTLGMVGSVDDLHGSFAMGVGSRKLGKRGRKGVQPGPRPTRMRQNSDSDGDSSSSSSDSDCLEELEVKIMLGALSMSELRVKQIMKKTVDKIFCVSADRRIDKDVVERVYETGFSRVLVFDEEQRRFIGYFLSRDLVAFAFKPESEAPLAKDLHLHQPIYFSGEETVGALYTTLCLVSTPIVIVTFGSPPAPTFDDEGNIIIVKGNKRDKNSQPVGLVTFEDVFETVQGTNISDETDMENDKAIQLKNKLQSAVAMRRENKRVVGALTRGMLRHDLTEDSFLDNTLSATARISGGVTSASMQGVMSPMTSAAGGIRNASPATRLLRRDSFNGMASYGGTNVSHSSAAAGGGGLAHLQRPHNQFGVSPIVASESPLLRKSHALLGDFGASTGADKDSFLTPRLRSQSHIGGTTPTVH